MNVKDAEFLKYILLENADYLFKKKKAEGVVNAILIEDLINEVLDQLSKNTDAPITEDTKILVNNFLQKKSIGTDFWRLKEGYILPTYYISDLFLIKANDYFMDEDQRREQPVPSLDYLIEAVSDKLQSQFGIQKDAKMITDLRSLLDRLCNEFKYFRKIQDNYVTFDTNGRARLEQIVAVTEK